jgi:Tfp pilus assembly PilM family ATPase
MIKNIFLPEKIKNYYLFKKRILGLDIGRTQINAALVVLKGTATILQHLVQEPIEPGPPTSLVERTQAALQKIITRVGKYDVIHSSLSSSLATFKELKLPFLSHEQIKLVVNFEVEPLLPFALQDAVIDFIITKQIPEEKSSEILVAAVQKQYIAQHLQFFEGLKKPDRIIIDLFALYGLFKQIPAYQIAGGMVLLDIGFHSTQLGYIYNGQLRLIRSVPQGITTLSKTISESLSISLNQAMETLIRFGSEKQDWPEYTKAANAALNGFWSTINFTLTSFTAQMPEQGITKMILLGEGTEINGLLSFIQQKLQIPCDLFNGSHLTPEIINTKQKNVSSTALMCISVAIPSPIIENFNLSKDEFVSFDRSLLIKQLVTALVLTILLFTLLITHFVIQVTRLNSNIQTAQQEAIEALQKRFKTIEPEETSLDEALNRAQLELNREEQTCFAFSSQARVEFLRYLLELTTKIDKEGLGFEAEQLTISNGTMILKARVKDGEALINLRRELRQSKLFKSIGPLDNTSFTVEIKLASPMEG